MTSSSHRPILRHVPNALTVARVLLAAGFPWSPPSFRTAIVLAALATEYLDGAISRRFNVGSRFGRLLDPVADKLFFASVALTFLAEGRLGAMELALLALRDIGVLAALCWLLLRGRWKQVSGLQPGRAGKLATVLQYGALLSLLFLDQLPAALVAITALAGVVAIAQYFPVLGEQTPRAG